ncbi:MAG: hypothetical protein Q9183_007404 [Haloplaca sp. 2 TL-2023]
MSSPPNSNSGNNGSGIPPLNAAGYPDVQPGQEAFFLSSPPLAPAARPTTTSTNTAGPAPVPNSISAVPIELGYTFPRRVARGDSVHEQILEHAEDHLAERLAYHWSQPEQYELPTNFPPGIAWIQSRTRGWIAFSLDTGIVDLDIRPRTQLDTQPSGQYQGGSGFGGHGPASAALDQIGHRNAAGPHGHQGSSHHARTASTTSTYQGFPAHLPPFFEFHRAGLTPGDTDRGIEWQLHNNNTHYRAWRQSELRM